MPICKRSFAIGALLTALAMSLMLDFTKADRATADTSAVMLAETALPRAVQEGAELARICPDGARIYLYRNPPHRPQLVTDDFLAFNEDVSIADVC